jgi:hypothetical protein
LIWVHCTLDQLVADSGRAALLKIQMIFQDPMASLNPRMRVADIVGEAPVVHGIVAKTEIDRHIDAQLARVGLDPGYKSRYPHQFSGGQRASIGIARALAVEPDFLVCDESVAALDVSIKAQVLNLFKAQVLPESSATESHPKPARPHGPSPSSCRRGRRVGQSHRTTSQKQSSGRCIGKSWRSGPIVHSSPTYLHENIGQVHLGASRPRRLTPRG